MPIRWRLTLFIALVIGAILLVLGLSLYFLSRSALLAGLEETARSRALSASQTIESGEDLSDEYVEQLTLDGVSVIVRDGNGHVLAGDGQAADGNGNAPHADREVRLGPEDEREGVKG